MKFHILFMITALSSLAHGHGEDKPGPHGGFIRMPGAFHVEIVPTGKAQAKVYLLDINWQNPSMKNAEVELVLGQKGRAKCSAQNGSFFLCSFPSGSDLSKTGELKVKAKREGQVGNEVTYELPFKLLVIDDGHGGH